ncbi:hypothetical protein [Paenibacillus kribbensis]|uniref:hypothetical protein n=1 Tax=Paenibacillus kribbensis TaxID=172713 RepID=UPI00211823B1|nr:hypothetical protein [Paenibacillus kribbensis]
MERNSGLFVLTSASPCMESGMTIRQTSRPRMVSLMFGSVKGSKCSIRLLPLA